MKPASDITALVIDHGRFLPVARRLGKDLRKVYYWSPWEKDCPTVREGLVGEGFPEIERVESIWQPDDVDLYVFPDIGFAAEQRRLIRDGKIVFGPMGADELETYRGRFLKKLEEIGLPTPIYVTLYGLSALREHLREQTDLYIKISKWRGDMESWHWRSWEEDEGTLDALAFRLGPIKDKLTFYVFDPIDADVEDGFDTFCVDGKCPRTCIHAMEHKDQALLATFAQIHDLPGPLKFVAEKFLPVLGDYGYRGFFSTEVRVTKDGTPYFIDPTLRAGSPPSQVQCDMIANYGEVVWGAANGQIMEPQPTAQFGVQAVLKARSSPDEWTTIKLPESLVECVKAGHAMQVDGLLCLPPGKAEELNLWLTATGDTIRDAIATLQGYVDELPEDLSCDMLPFVKILDEVYQAEKQGMEFTDQTVPGPEVVVEEKE